MTYSDRLKKIIEVIRARPEWEPNHRDMLFGGLGIGYYDTESKDGYFVVKYKRVEANHHHDGEVLVSIVNSPEHTINFSLDEWLKEVEEIIFKKRIEIDGVKYFLIEENND